MNDLKKRQSESIRAKLRNLAKKRSAPFEVILTSFLIERAVRRLMTDDQLVGNLIFKGGFVSISIYSSPRFTIDLDAVLHGITLDDAETLSIESLRQDFEDGVWFTFESSLPLTNQTDYGGRRLQFRSGLFPQPEDIKRAKILHIDLGVGDPVTPKALKLTTPSLLGGEDISWSVYPVETICSEKIHPFVLLGSSNSRSKDLFDLYFLLPKVDLIQLREAIRRTFQYRATPVPSSFFRHFQRIDKRVLTKGWLAATVDIKPLPIFEHCWDSVLSFFEEYNL